MSAGQEQPSAPRVVMSWPWIVVMLGVGLLVGLLLIALLSLRRAEHQAIEDSAPPFQLPTVGAAATSSPESEAPVVAVDVTASPPTPLLAPPAPAPVTGQYGVASTFHDGFIGEVLLVNPGDRPSGWTVTLSFARGRLAAAWVDGAEQGTASFADGVFTYRSGVDLAPGASARLRFQFEKTRTTEPTSCTVNGTECSGR
ncbi:Cellulose binding domain-containing protein [Micromonospora viridifaciens]|uniref:Cellulose binding domain-containing protein n=1 Tax=Micromonospora viridifaciens TaxID=1881 RepID=A0A1C4W9G3_MICVI|nr:cellulose binding domain-containing protein [Micromonospora viridifaciens]SCE92838.1 Cellulose binding domain-containing protein [Micromonospora viridifaciens]